MILDACRVAVLLFTSGLFACWLADQVEALTEAITCRCGRQAVSVSVVDKVDAQRRAETLTEGCTHRHEQAAVLAYSNNGLPDAPTGLTSELACQVGLTGSFGHALRVFFMV